MLSKQHPSQIFNHPKPINTLQLWPFNLTINSLRINAKSHPECFINPDSREQWLTALENKINQTQQEIQETQTNLPENSLKIF